MSEVRATGTIGATVALLPFVVPVGSPGRLATPLTGFLGSAPAGGVPWPPHVARRDVGAIAERLGDT